MPNRFHILVVDDEPVQREMVSGFLKKQAFNVTSAESGGKGLELFRQESFDLVITDQAMPGITGSAMAEEMLRLRPDLPVILCTGFSGRIDEETVKKLGIAAFVPKPFGVEDIAPIIRKVLGEDQHFRRV